MSSLDSYGAPKRLQKVATSYGGTNPYGQPMYRLVWGSDRKEWKYVGARYDKEGQKLEEPGIRLVPKHRRERYHIEKWCPPTFYGTPEAWAIATLQVHDGKQVETLGPYPNRGDYELLWTFETPEGKYLEPTTDVLITAIQRNQRATARTFTEEVIDRRREDARVVAAVDSEKRTVTRELTKEFIEKAMPGRTVRQLKEELTAPRR